MKSQTERQIKMNATTERDIYAYLAGKVLSGETLEEITDKIEVALNGIVHGGTDYQTQKEG